MKTTRDFDEQVRRKRAYLKSDECAEAIRHPLRRETQADGRVRHWTAIMDGAGVRRYLRVITLDDGETVHNAFLDRNFREDGV